MSSGGIQGVISQVPLMGQREPERRVPSAELLAPVGPRPSDAHLQQAAEWLAQNPRVKHFIMSRLPRFRLLTGLEADDVVQELCLRIKAALDRGAKVHDPLRWMIRIIQNMLLDFSSAAERRARFEGPSIPPKENGDVRLEPKDPRKNPEQVLRHEALKAALEGAIASLDPSEQFIVNNCLSMQNAEMGAVLMLGADIVKMRRFRAMRKLRPLLQDFADESPDPG